MTEVVLVMGAGGVGKTTVAAGWAARAARSGQFTLVVTVDPARRLADAMGMAVGNEPAPVPGHPRLEAAMLDATAAWEHVARAHADPATARRLLANPYFRAVADRFPSGQGYAAAEVLLHQVERDRYDVIVVDTPPAEGGTAFLEAPRRIRTLVAGRALRLLTAPRVPGRRLLYAVTARPALSLADAVLGGRLLEDVADFLLDLSAIYPGVARRSRRIEELFAAAEVVAVATPEPGPVAEARRIVTARASDGAPPARVVFNRMLPAGWARASGTGPAPLAGWTAEASRHERLRADFAEHTGVVPVAVPWLAEPPATPSEVADLLAAADRAALS